MVFVTTADGSKGIDAIPYETLKSDARKAARDLRKKLEDVDVLGGEPESEQVEDAPSDEVTLLSEPESWTNSDGKAIRAAIRKVEDGQVEFIMPQGNSVMYPLSKLSAESQAKIAELQGAE